MPHSVCLLVGSRRLTDPFGGLLWASPALPGSTHDLTVARTHGIVEALTLAGRKCWADKAYQGAGSFIRVRLAAVACSELTVPPGTGCNDRPRASGYALWGRSVAPMSGHVCQPAEKTRCE